MHAVARQREHIRGGIAVAAAGIVAVTPVLPVSPLQTADTVVRRATQLVADDSLLNVPLNLAQALFNAPANMIHGYDVVGQSLLFSGPWLVGSPTNVWGEDPGDPAHFQGITDLFVPFPVLSGAGHEGDMDYPGLGQQLSMLLSVEIPADKVCESLWCLPVMPTSPITGLTGLDQGIWSLAIAMGLQKFPLINNWFQVPFSDMTNGNSYFFDPTSVPMQDAGIAHDQYLWQGTITPAQALENLHNNPNYDEIIANDPGLVDRSEAMDPNTPLMPWAGTSYAMDFQQPFDNFWQSLQEPCDASKFALPNLSDVARSLQTNLSSYAIAFNPLVPGSPFCPGPCLFPDLDSEHHLQPTYYIAIQALNDMWKGNPVLDEWLRDYADGTANISTPSFIASEANLWRWNQTLLDFNNPGPTDPGELPPFPDIGQHLPSLDEIHQSMNSLLGPGVGDYLFNFFMNSGVFAPFSIEGFFASLAGIPHDPVPLINPGEYVTDGAPYTHPYMGDGTELDAGDGGTALADPDLVSWLGEFGL
jgi:hypothetical protein